MNMLVNDFLRHDRRALAKLITIVESHADESRDLAREILPRLPKAQKPSLRLAISGPPGVGKSTFINRLAHKLLHQGLKIAILPIDPASEESKGSILADKTRMGDIINEPDIFIRPSSSRGVLGGINLGMSDVIFVVESFGFDVVIIETTGVGQAETLAYTLADFFTVLMQPGSGDALQAMKKGILEKADFVLVNKADGDLLAKAQEASHALHHVLKKNTPVMMISSLDNTGFDAFLGSLQSAFCEQIDKKILGEKRKQRLEAFVNFALQERLMPRLLSRPKIKNRQQQILECVISQEEALGPLADKLSEEILSELKNF